MCPPTILVLFTGLKTPQRLPASMFAVRLFSMTNVDSVEFNSEMEKRGERERER
jgi:hypothetical protein